MFLQHSPPILPTKNISSTKSVWMGSIHQINGYIEQINAAKPKRPFCERCCKPAVVCICNRIQKQVENVTAITILQHTDERKHPCGSVRVASLGLKNLEIISVRDLELETSHRVKPKVPGSKRSIARRIGRKGLIAQNNGDSQPGQDPADKMCSQGPGSNPKDQNLCIPEWVCLPSGSALLFPSENAVDLLPGFADFEVKHLVVLDGTWGKARRIYYENPWLRLLPHFRLPLKWPSIYSEVRREPKPGCLSTIESIVYALKILEPGTDGLDSLLQVFASMVKDQRRCKEERLQKLGEEEA
ncbi:uncharacterized protein LOC131032118 [Cryptomeria japonica]|uniref:uncharacterized protein LOC131032118 n=1 Tax=Cryptomeria japonica TaxID=3369 RepID=UPI0027DA5844|nr:uncharacterized protein LOC131032118 [Cryptomeria japonica]